MVELGDRAEWTGIPTVVLGELRTGFLLGKRPDENEVELLDSPHDPRNLPTTRGASP